MKKLACALIVFSVFAPAWAQEPDAAVAERARIAVERADVQARFAQDEKACYQRFAVNSCIDDAKARRRNVLTGLRRTEIELNDAERQRRGAAKLREIEERAAEQKSEEQAAQRARALADQQAREARGADKASSRSGGDLRREQRAGRQASGAQRAQDRQAATPALSASEAAQNAQRFDDRARNAQDRKERVEKRASGRIKPDKPASALPVPP